MKRILAFTLAFTLAMGMLLVILTACGSKDTKEKESSSQDRQTVGSQSLSENSLESNVDKKSEESNAELSLPVSESKKSEQEDPSSALKSSASESSTSEFSESESMVSSQIPEEDDGAEIVAKIGNFEVCKDLYRYTYTAAKQGMLEEDPDVFTNNENAEKELLDTVEDMLKELSWYFNLYWEKGYTLPEDVNSRYEEEISYLNEMYRLYYGISFEDYLEIVGLTKIGYKDIYLLNEVIEPQVLEVLTDKETGLIDRSAEAIAEVAKDYVTVKHILVGYNDGLSDEEALALANSLIERIRNGEDMDALMKEYSNDYHEGDNIYTFTYFEMVQQFEEASFALSENELSEPIKTNYGYHIILKLPLAEKFYESIYPNIAAEKYIAAHYQEQTAEYGEEFSEFLAVLRTL